jgi:hypothetical protein
MKCLWINVWNVKRDGNFQNLVYVHLFVEMVLLLVMNNVKLIKEIVITYVNLYVIHHVKIADLENVLNVKMDMKV